MSCCWQSTARGALIFSGTTGCMVLATWKLFFLGNLSHFLSKVLPAKMMCGVHCNWLRINCRQTTVPKLPASHGMIDSFEHVQSGHALGILETRGTFTVNPQLLPTIQQSLTISWESIGHWTKKRPVLLRLHPRSRSRGNNVQLRHFLSHANQVSLHKAPSTKIQTWKSLQKMDTA